MKKNSPVGTLFNFLALLVGLFAITGVYLWQREAAGTFGVIAYVLVFVGLALMMCIDYLGAFVMPGLNEEELARRFGLAAGILFGATINNLS